MEFRTYFPPDLGINILIAEGEISTGDAQRFLAAVPNADRDIEGHIILVLNSPGGSVSAAFKLVEAMDKVGVFTLVPDNAQCASACASIVYPSGIRRNIVGTGLLGFHSCYKKVGGRIEESALCNEKIAQHAIARGLAHASVSLFTEDFGARDMAWVNREVACKMLIGMCRPTLRDLQPTENSAIRPSFDCQKSRTKVEILICATPKLARMDARMSIAYFTSQSNNNSQALLIEQRLWLKQKRNKCTSVQCLTLRYQERIEQLESL